MKKILLFAVALCFSIPAHATKIKPTDLKVLVARADYIVVGKIVKVDMIDDSGHEINDEKARTGHGSRNTIRYYVVIDKNKILKGNNKKIPKSLVLPDWPLWIRDLGGMKKFYGGKIFIFLLRDPDFFPEPRPEFIRDINEKKEIEIILRSQRHNIKR